LLFFSFPCSIIESGKEVMVFAHANFKTECASRVVHDQDVEYQIGFNIQTNKQTHIYIYIGKLCDIHGIII